MHCKDVDVQQLRHDLRNGPAHVFGLEITAIIIILQVPAETATFSVLNTTYTQEIVMNSDEVWKIDET